VAPGADEDAPLFDPPAEGVEEITDETYGPLKVACEQVVAAALPDRALIVRPGLIVGPDDPTDRFTYWIRRVAEGGEVLAPAPPEDPVQFIDVRDLAEWMVNAIAERHIGVYNLVGPAKPMAMGDLLQTCIDVTGSDARLTWVDAKFLVDHQAVPGADLPIWLPPEGETLGFAQMSNARAVATGLSFRTPRDTVQATLDWWKGLPEERRAHTRAGWPAAREAEVLAAWREIGKKAA
jgi:2'-hydroxyisoflavone reductase